MNALRLSMFFFIMSAQACSGSQLPQSSKNASLRQTALVFKNAGDHINASYYLEAAVVETDQPDMALYQLLVEEQILAGRLLAARDSLKQLEEKFPPHPSIQNLRKILEALVGYPSDRATQEVSL
ncbi:MAG: hypothetical protein JXX29_16790 [Deltaproteobacteria bacterium]|nr:hypothetical protein [Deltaproteobacteria bacterium]MBN2673343.1 hypothetical protein [Deltaproteobacteria bacterium]